jgi:hypothetical protein
MNALLLAVLLSSAGDLSKVVVTEDSTNKMVKPGDFTNKALRVNCVTGCSGSSSSSGGKVLDGTASGEADVLGSAPAGTEQALVTRNIPSGTQPVSGTFWQATQPVSGTVTANAGSGTMAVSGTFWQATQPVSGPSDRHPDPRDRAACVWDVLASNAARLGHRHRLEPHRAGAHGRAAPGGRGPRLGNVLPGHAASQRHRHGQRRIPRTSGTMAVSGPLTDTQIRATALPVSGTVTANIGTAGTLALDATLTGGTAKARVSGNAGAALDAANNAAMPANAIAVGAQTATIDTTPTAATAGNLRYQLASTEGVLYVQEGGPKRFSCILNAVTVLTQCQAAPAAGLRAYVTSVTLSNQAATVQTLDVVYGTGSNCATAAAAITHKVQFGTNATTTSPQSYGMSFPTPLVPVAANAICVRPSAATAFGATLTGYDLPHGDARGGPPARGARASPLGPEDRLVLPRDGPAPAGAVPQAHGVLPGGPPSASASSSRPTASEKRRRAAGTSSPVT